MTISLDRLRHVIALVLIGFGILVAMWRTDESWKISFRCHCEDLFLVAPEQHFQNEIGKNLLFILPTALALFIHPAPGLLVGGVTLGALLWIDRAGSYGFPGSTLRYFLQYTARMFMGLNTVAVLFSLFELWVRRNWKPEPATPDNARDNTPPDFPLIDE